MPTLHGTIDKPLDEAGAAIRHAAGANKYAVSEGESTPQLIVLRKGRRCSRGAPSSGSS